MQTNPVMTADEIRLFRGFTIREERLESGRLTRPELAALEQLRTMLERLREKYPGSALEPVRFQPGWGVSRRPELRFRGAGSRELCTAVLTVSSQGEARLSDNYWGALVQPQAVALASRLFPALRIEAVIRSLMGDEVGAGLSFRSACDRRLPFCPHFQVTVLPGQLPPRLLDDWRERAEQAGLYGFFQFRFSTGEPGEEPLGLGSFGIPCPHPKEREVSSWR